MAYTFQDYYRTIRWLFRWTGLVLGLGLGSLLLFLPAPWLMALGLPATTPLWMVRAGGAALLGNGVARLLAAQETEPSLGLLVGAAMGDGILALVLFIAYFQGQFQGLHRLGQAGLLVVFTTCLLSVLTVLTFLRTAYRR